MEILEILDPEYMAMRRIPQYYDYVAFKDEKVRRIIVNDIIQDSTVDELIMPIIRWNEEDEAAGLAVEDRTPIRVFVNTDGGDLLVGFLVMNVFKSSKTPIHTYALAKAASCGSIILMAGHKRFAYPFSTILIHDGSIGVSGSSNKAKDTMKFFEEREVDVKAFYLGNSKITDELFESKKDREWYLTGKEALELGIVDELL